MQCSDLDRYLEAYLDGRLGRSRSLVLRRHLAGCLACRARFERLRQFERDLAARIRTMERCDPIWNGLELDLVKSGEAALPGGAQPLRALPPPRREPVAAVLPAPTGRSEPPRPAEVARSARRIKGRLLGLALFAAGAGVTLQLGFWLLDRSSAGGALALLELVKGEPPLELRSPDPVAVRGWLADRLATPVPPLAVPAGFELLGGRIDELDGLKSGVLVYRRAGETALLYLQPRHDGRAGELGTDLLAKLDGGARLAWHDREFSYAVVSTLPAAELASLREPAPAR
ncbi:MAG: zf-HC2 domain-containing protein [Geminicoccaceae bacterium]|nr:zf-HC2 domain-containing protein [Geminicoccaceae bacterium]MCX8100692.1 zf-HC2 domain-containing protein [Geminicoccaceae bacterium]MDW8371137.1 zf-HC2 domain-containing protein [Geminicoccaceae bacterium]